MASQGRIIILSGPSGSGKTTLYQKLLKSPRFKSKIVRSVSATTRAKRPQEKEGRDYFFFSPAEFLARRKKGYFLEWKKVFTNYYGTPAKPVLKHLKRGKNVILAIDVKGAQDVYKKHPEALKIFVKTQSLEVLKKRLEGRGTESPESLAVRLKIAKKELKKATDYDYVIVNDDLTRCFNQLLAILKKELSIK